MSSSLTTDAAATTSPPAEIIADEMLETLPLAVRAAIVSLKRARDEAENKRRDEENKRRAEENKRCALETELSAANVQLSAATAKLNQFEARKFWFLTIGLPPRPPPQAAVQAVAEGGTSTAVAAQRLPGRFEILSDLTLVDHEAAVYHVITWPWCGEPGIQTFVTGGLQGATAAASLPMVFIAGPAPMPDGVTLAHRFPDLVLFDEFSAFLVCEVKVPCLEDKDLSNSTVLSRPAVIGQIFDYIVALRSQSGRRFGFGLVSTYDSWLICYTTDSADVAAATTLEDLRRALAPSRSAAHQALDVRDRALHCVEFAYNDPRAVRMLASLVYKAKSCPRDAPVALVAVDRPYMQLSTVAPMQWVILRETPTHQKVVDGPLQPSLPPPPQDGDSETFILLRYYGEGADGKVWLVCTPDAKMAILKLADEPARLEQEADSWRAWYGVPARVVRIMRRDKIPGDATQIFMHALVMPFAFVYDARSNSFIGPNTRAPNHRFAPADNIAGRETMEKALAALSPNKVKDELVRGLMSRQQVHGDLANRHMAMLPYLDEKTNEWGLRPVLVDLARARDALPGEVREQVEQWLRDDPLPSTTASAATTVGAVASPISANGAGKGPGFAGTGSQPCAKAAVAQSLLLHARG